MRKSRTFNLKEAAERVGVAPITLKRWLLAGKVAEVVRDRNGWRVFTVTDVKRIKHYASAQQTPGRK